MATSDDLLTSLRRIEAGVLVGTSTLTDARQALNAYIAALAAEKKVSLPSPLPDASNYTVTLSRYAGGTQSYADVEATRTAYVNTVIPYQPTLAEQINLYKTRLAYALSSGASPADIADLRNKITMLESQQYQPTLAEQVNLYKTRLAYALSSGASPADIADLQNKLAALQRQEASGNITTVQNQEASNKLATNPMKEILTFAVLTSPAWVPLLLLRMKVI